jgi:hypothetical protein
LSVTMAAKPIITTTSVTTLSSTSATGGGNIFSDGGSVVTLSGICWSTSPSPTIADYKTTDGSLTGPFTSIMTGLTENITYYVRAYATNCAGTGYGSEVTFNRPNLIDNFKIDDISVYPNPVSGELNIDYRNEDFKTVKILNLVGVMLHKENTITPKQKIDFSRYEYGMYILEFVKSNGSTKRIKIINH